MERKWEYLTRRCVALGYGKAAGIASKIDAVLVDLYGQESTPAWLQDSYRADQFTITEIAAAFDYCIACCHHKRDCYSCNFGASKGICTYPGSLFREFIDSLHALENEEKS